MSIFESMDYTYLDSDVCQSLRILSLGPEIRVKRTQKQQYGGAASTTYLTKQYVLFTERYFRVSFSRRKQWNAELSRTYIYTAPEAPVPHSQILSRLQTFLNSRHSAFNNSWILNKVTETYIKVREAKNDIDCDFSNDKTVLPSHATRTISGMGKTTGVPTTLPTLPVELQELIFQHLPQSARHVLLFTNSKVANQVTPSLYVAPYFASSYRFAQFTHWISRNPCYAELVRDLDLSYLAEEYLDEKGEFLPLAGWREFKYRDSSGFFIPREKTHGQEWPWKSNHAPPSPEMNDFQYTRDVPLGGLARVLAACKNIRSINFSNLELASDFILSPLGTDLSLPPTPPTATTPTYVSDVPKSWIWSHRELKGIYADYIVNHLTTLENLENVTTRNVLWMDTVKVATLCGPQGPKRLKLVDFRGCVMEWRQWKGRVVEWMVKDSRTHLWELLESSFQQHALTAEEAGANDSRPWVQW